MRRVLSSYHEARDSFTLAHARLDRAQRAGTVSPDLERDHADAKARLVAIVERMEKLAGAA